jgi:hypothetical protein
MKLDTQPSSGMSARRSLHKVTSGLAKAFYLIRALSEPIVCPLRFSAPVEAQLHATFHSN